MKDVAKIVLAAVVLAMLIAPAASVLSASASASKAQPLSRGSREIFTLSEGGKTPEGVKKVVETSVGIALPPGTFYAFKIDTAKGLIVPQKTFKPELPGSAIEALKKVPDWIKPLLKRQFYLLMQGDLKVSKRSVPASADINGDGLPDMAVGSGDGVVEIYINVGVEGNPLYKHLTTLDPAKDLGLNATLNYTAPAFGDIDGNGLIDVVIGLENGSLLLYKNIGEKSSPSWALDATALNRVKVDAYAAPYLFDVDEDGDLDLIVGSASGIIHCFINKGTPGKPEWVEDTQYFPAWIENWYDGRGPHYEGVWVGNYSKPALFKHGDATYLLVGVEDGEVYLFRAVGSTGYPAWSNMGSLEDIVVSSHATPEVADLNGDDIMDLLLGGSDGAVYYVRNYGSPIYPGFRPWPSGAEKYLLANWFWGPAYYPTLDTLPTTGVDLKYVEKYASLILNTSEPYVDEVAYAVAVDRPSNLKMLADRGGDSLYLLNAKSIYDIAENLSYVQLSEHPGYTTLKYRTEKGWVEAPKEVYYKYLVTFSRYLIAPWAWPSRYNGKFYRTFLPYDKTYNVSLIERVANATTLREAAYMVDYWLRVDIGAVWHMGPKWKPRGWYNIYLQLTNPEYAILCGEFSIIYEVSARSVLIPTINVVDIAEDHQFNNFWYDGKWHHVDASSGSPGVNGTWAVYFDPPRGLAGWYKDIGFSYPIEWEENGMYDPPWRSKVEYAPEGMLANLHFNVVDEKGKPVDGARVEVWSHWTIESHYDTAPYIAGFVFTDMNGEAYFPMLGLGRTHNFTIIVTSRIGSTMFEIHLEKRGNYSFNVVIPGKLPDTPSPIELPLPSGVKTYIKLNATVIGGEQNPPSWIDILYRLFDYKYYVEFTKGVWVDAYLLPEEEFAYFKQYQRFAALGAAERVGSISTGYIPVNGTLYLVLSNRRSVATTVFLNITIGLYKDVKAPTVEIRAPADKALINKNTVSVVFSSPARDVAYFEISVDGSPFTRATSPYVVANLSDGSHVVQVRATDISGNTGSPASVSFTVDTTPPVIVLTNVADGQLVMADHIEILGKVTGAVKAWFNGVELALTPQGGFKAEATLAPGLNPLNFTAVDKAGNRAEMLVRVYYYPHIATKEDVESAASNITGAVGEAEHRISERMSKEASSLYSNITRDLLSTASDLKNAIVSSTDDIKNRISSLENSLGDKISKLSTTLSKAVSDLGVKLSDTEQALSNKISGQKPLLYTIIGLAIVNIALTGYFLFKKPT